MLALIVTSEMAEYDRAEIWHTHSGCIDTSSPQIIAL
jgi:hypothetical protein